MSDLAKVMFSYPCTCSGDCDRERRRAAMELNRMERALVFYAKPENHSERDAGWMARDALAKLRRVKRRDGGGMA